MVLGGWGGRIDSLMLKGFQPMCSIESSGHSASNIQEKKREYDQRVREIEYSTFNIIITPLVLSFGRNGKIGYYTPKISRNDNAKTKTVKQSG